MKILSLEIFPHSTDFSTGLTLCADPFNTFKRLILLSVRNPFFWRNLCGCELPFIAVVDFKFFFTS